MAQKYRIYINDNTLFIADSVPVLADKIQQLDTQGFDFPAFCNGLGKTGKRNYILIGSDPKKIFQRVKKSCELIKAAGGLAESAKGRYLFIFRNGKWDLPKGKLEKGEKMKIAAVREVEEECGIEVAKREEKLCKTYHVYPYNDGYALKKTNWYRMKVKGEPKLVPQVEEGITRAVWMKAEEIPSVLTNTFPSIVDVLLTANLLPGQATGTAAFPSAQKD
ncbi:NUDIX hydrolase [Pedobacter yulinensis]|uniref:NUDIX hydrolase n=1 Tax=Pedobacter yulinensis TaxID=2126353 RepID=A0A2T3HJQ3_9SPHI|nr:NUDIX domain-containing protein [Pedobacter yulinensis]PST82649.1 NUDIX hydrolase [Pedobacter yulinensis]